MLRRVHIAGDGTPKGTRITDADTGAELPNVCDYTVTSNWSDPRRPGLPVAHLTLLAPKLDVVAAAEVETVTLAMLHNAMVLSRVRKHLAELPPTAERSELIALCEASAKWSRQEVAERERR